MTKMLTYTLNALLLATLLFSCGGPTADTVTSASESPEAVSSEPALDILEEHEMEKDVIKATAEASPEHIQDKKLPEPEVLDPTPTSKPKVSPAPPSKPASDATRTEAPVVNPKTPASSEPVVQTASAPIPDKPEVPTHDVWNTLLQQHVNKAGNVNYAAFKKDESRLDAYLAELAENAPTTDWTRREGMAYWINAYNAATIKMILKNWPVKSIMDLHGGKPWDVKWIKLGEKTYSLNNIEHDILRPRYKDPNIHFAVNCAAASCPPIPNMAFTPSNLTGLMESRARNFIRNPAYNTIGETVAVSKIFDWYAEDFGDLRDYLNKYAATQIPEGTTIGFREYDWGLNKQ
ncbi:DUF547 domain-containing protein [Neolewinella persica]|uniref:DUF547 domain-containing protein n=1 Tax=Neolewinella persica TaxID=70998 RepID=UPI00036E4E70|nr:DUF547 domain-containing protein [Neolewinella persica]